MSMSASVRTFAAGADITALTKTWNRPEFPDNLFADLRSSNVFHRDRFNGVYWGVALILKKSLKGFRRTDLECSQIEFLVVEPTTAPLVIGVFYGSPSTVFSVLPLLIQHIRKNFSSEEISRFLWTGDSNLPVIKWSNHTAKFGHSKDLLHCLKEFSLR